MRLVLTLALASLALAACTPPHYTVVVARGPTHVTFGQRNHEAEKSDYLVDCRVDAAGQPTECKTIPLEVK